MVISIKRSAANSKDDLAGGLRSWFGRVFSGRARAERRLELLETLSLGGKRQLMLVRCEGQRYLVGVGGDGVQSIVNAGEAGDARGAAEASGVKTTPVAAIRGTERKSEGGLFGESFRAAMQVAEARSAVSAVECEG